MKITLITFYRGYDAEFFGKVVKGILTTEQKDAWRKMHKADEFHCSNGYDCDDHNNMFFKELELVENPEPTMLFNVNGEIYA